MSRTAPGAINCRISCHADKDHRCAVTWLSLHRQIAAPTWPASSWGKSNFLSSWYIEYLFPRHIRPQLLCPSSIGTSQDGAVSFMGKKSTWLPGVQSYGWVGIRPIGRDSFGLRPSAVRSSEMVRNFVLTIGGSSGFMPTQGADALSSSGLPRGWKC